MRALNYIEKIILEDLEAGRCTRPITTRFPPEPGGILHIGHARSIFINLLTAERFGGCFNLRLDDTDPLKNYAAYTQAVIEDVKSLGINLEDRIFYASDYFEALYNFAIRLIRQGDAFVCDLPREELKNFKGDYYTPGRPSPFRERSVKENLELFDKMAAGDVPSGSRVLRARIDYNHPNILMRDPVMYRTLNIPHYRQGDRWKIYPTYDFSHCLCDHLEGVTHSLCGKEFEVHRPLYDWFLEKNGVPNPPRQIEFAEFTISNTLLGKRHIRRLIEEKRIAGWEDPRLFTFRGMKKRGYPLTLLKSYFADLPVSRTHSVIPIQTLEEHYRSVFNDKAERRMVVSDPVLVKITNFPENHPGVVKAENNPEHPEEGSRFVPFGKEIYIERSDFMVDPPGKYHRLSPGKEVRLKYGALVTATDYTLDPDTEEISEIVCTMDTESAGPAPSDGRRVKGTIHWVDAETALPLTLNLFSPPDPGDPENPAGTVQKNNAARGEAHCLNVPADTVVQFERLGYFFPVSGGTGDKPEFNRVTPLRDSWARLQKKA